MMMNFEFIFDEFSRAVKTRTVSEVKSVARKSVSESERMRSDQIARCELLLARNSVQRTSREGSSV